MSTLIHNCSILDGSSAKVLEKGWVLLSQGRIARLGQGEPPAGADQLLDAGGGTLLPGLINLHVHVHRRHLHRESSSFRQGGSG